MAVRCEVKLDSILASRALCRDDLDKPCASECLEKMAFKLTRWKVLCPFLGLSADEEVKVLKSYQKNSKRRAGMLKLWREKFGDEATYLKLALGFEAAELGEMMINLLDWLKESEMSAKPTRRMVATVPKLNDRPRPQQLIRVTGKSGKEIIIRDTIAFDWEDLYSQLHRSASPEEITSKLKEIRENSRDEDEEACREVLLLWLSGNTGVKPVTWATLIDLIRDIGQGELADELSADLMSA